MPKSYLLQRIEGGRLFHCLKLVTMSRSVRAHFLSEPRLRSLVMTSAENLGSAVLNSLSNSLDELLLSIIIGSLTLHTRDMLKTFFWLTNLFNRFQWVYLAVGVRPCLLTNRISSLRTSHLLV